MKLSLLVLVFSLLLPGQNVQIKGRVYETGHPEKGIPGVTVALKVAGEPDRTKLTGQNGSYTFEPVKRGKGVVTFTKKNWQPDPRNEAVDLKPAVVQLDVDLFQQNAVTFSEIVNWKANVINTAARENPAIAPAVFDSQWRSCQEAEIPVRERVLCAQTMTKQVNSSIARPYRILNWANIDGQKLNYLEGMSTESLWTTGKFDITTLSQTGLPDDVVYSHVIYELNKSNASEDVKQRIQGSLKNELKAASPEKMANGR